MWAFLRSLTCCQPDITSHLALIMCCFILQLIWCLPHFPNGLWASWGQGLYLFVFDSSRPNGAWLWVVARVYWIEMDSLFSFELFLSNNSSGLDYLVKRQEYFWELILSYCIYLYTFLFYLLDCALLQDRVSLLLISFLSSALTLIDLLLRNQ